jgi:hypothetical protein
MSDTETRGGFTGDPAAALTPTGGSGCCGSAPSAVVPPDPVAGSACCGTRAEATAEDSCCGSAAKAGAIASHQGCCG